MNRTPRTFRTLGRFQLRAARLAPMALVALALQATPATAQTGAPASQTAAERARGGEALAAGLIVKFRDGTRSEVAARATMQGLRAHAQGRGLAVVRGRDTGTSARVIHLQRPVPARELQAMARELMLYDPAIEYVEPNYVMEHHFTPNDTRFAEQYALAAGTGGISAPLAWDFSKGTNTRVAVLDTGVLMHADLAGNLLPGYDLVSTVSTDNDGTGRDSSPLDPGDYAGAGDCGVDKPARNSSWHGTHVSGIVAALGNNNQGVSGVAPGAKVVPVRIAGRCGRSTNADMADGVLWALGQPVAGVPANANPVRIINISMGGYYACPQTMQAAINKAVDMGAMVVVSAGNENVNAGTSSPANCKGVLTVAATNSLGNKSSFSNSGAVVSLSAPGSGVLSTHNNGALGPVSDSYQFLDGTSMAAPHVAGVVALMASVNPGMGMGAAKTLLKETATPFTTACSGCGSGIVNAHKAVLAARAWRRELEPNNTAAQAQLIAVPVVDIWGNLEGGTKADDEDHFTVSLPPRTGLKVELINMGVMFKMAFSGQLSTGQTVMPSTTVLSGDSGSTTRYNSSFDRYETMVLKVRRASVQSASMLEQFYRLKVSREAYPF